MARFHPIYARRSDGKLEMVAKGRRKERNEPTAEQLDQKPDKNGVSDFYREVAVDEMKSLDWRRKLGGMLARELDWKDPSGQDQGCILVAFPENYRLYEHVKKTEKDGKTEVKSKNHAGGGNDRQDAYLYGHPIGRRKRFRSPADFFPHLLWLCQDESGDPDNCGCKICSPEDLENTIPGAKMKMERPFKQDADLRPTVAQTGAPHAGAGMIRQSSVQSTRVKQDTSVPAPKLATVPQPLMPTPLAPPKTSDQRLDSQYGNFMYRPGELVWFRRGQAWGLGAVLRRWVTSTNEYNYTVQPLSYPGNYPQAVTKSSDLEMRPWLAWSVPRFTNDGLNNLSEPARYETADWHGIQHRRYGAGDIEVDGSILAAKSIDATYTPFGLNKATEPEPNVSDRYYDGVFLGAEKLWAGDPVRLHMGSGSDIMVVHSVVERQRRPTVGQHLAQPSVHLIGDVYTLATVNHSNPAMPSPAAATNNPQLPSRLAEDLAHRNARSIAAKRTASYWKLIAKQQRLELNDIKGRWYEASILLPILQQSQYDEAARKGEIQEASLWMNSRGDCQNSNRAQNQPRVAKLNVRKETRREALGRAAPPGAEISDGVAPPVPDGVDPALGGHIGAINNDVMDVDSRYEAVERAQQQHATGTANSNAGFSEIMDLDRSEDRGQLPGFGQQSQRGYY